MKRSPKNELKSIEITSLMWAVLYISYLPTDHGRRYFSEINIKKDDFYKNHNFSKIGKNRVLGRFWSNSGSGFEFCEKNCIYYLVQIHFSSIFENPTFLKFSISLFFDFLAIFRLILTSASDAP